MDEHSHPHGHAHSHNSHSHDLRSHDEHAHDDHGHGGTTWAKLRHAVSELTGAHSHDPADRIDAAAEVDAQGRRALWSSFALLALTAALQGVVVLFTGSVALLGDTLHNIVDALTAAPLLIAFWLGRRPATKKYNYGYGRAEDLAGVFVIAMIALSAVLAAYEAIERLLHPRPVTQLWAVALAAVIGCAGNEIVARYRIRVGRRIGSAALVADGLHARTDGVTSLAVLLGAAGVALGWPAADPVIGLLITVAILGVLRSAVAQVAARLMDAVDPTLVDAAMAAVGSVTGVREVAELRLRWIGHTLRAEVDATVDSELTLAQAHAVAHHAEEHLVNALPRLTAATVHVSPAA